METIKIKKLDRIKNDLEINKSKMRCPQCHSSFCGIEGNSLICSKSHCFDIAKKGYINLLKSNNSDIYNKGLFESRKRVYTCGIYRCLFEEISYIVLDNMKNKSENIILDAGSGEGYLLNYLSKAEAISDRSKLMGVDISKEAIQIAAREEQNILWCVSDLSNLPVHDKKISIILNMLSPANYREFKRILNPQGVVIKVVPEEGYLKEIRENLSGYIEKDFYSNKKIVDKFKENLNLIYEDRIRYSVKIDHSVFMDLLKMTPLTAKIPDIKLKNIMKLDIDKITIDLKLLVGSIR